MAGYSFFCIFMDEIKSLKVNKKSYWYAKKERGHAKSRYFDQICLINKELSCSGVALTEMRVLIGKYLRQQIILSLSFPITLSFPRSES